MSISFVVAPKFTLIDHRFPAACVEGGAGLGETCVVMALSPVQHGPSKINCPDCVHGSLNRSPFFSSRLRSQNSGAGSRNAQSHVEVAVR